MYLRDLLEVEIEGWKKVQCWEDDNEPTIYYEGYDIDDMEDEYLDMEINYMFPVKTEYEAILCIELVRE